MLRLDDVALSAGGQEILEDVRVHLTPGARMGLVGRNGAGKTTLLRAMLGELTPDRGSVHRRGGIRVGWLPQHGVSGSDRSVWEEVSDVETPLTRLKQELADAERRMEAGEPGGAEALADATEAFRLAGGFAEEQRIGSVLHGLGFDGESWKRPVDSFSGGWQVRVALARLLVSQPDVALLDEPTNHLDVHARSWLAGHLARMDCSLVIVSHDRHLLDRVCTEILELRRGHAYGYSGNFSSFLKQRAERRATQAATFEKQQAELAKLQRFVDRFGAKATKAAQARSKQKAIDRMEIVDAPERPDGLPRFRLPEAPESSYQVLELIQASVGWPGGDPIVKAVDLSLERGMRLALLGPNGCGKSTLLRTLAGHNRPLQGQRRPGDRLRMGVFHQDLASALPQDSTAVEHVQSAAPLAATQQVRSILGALGLSGDSALRAIGTLSGGERARVALAALAIRPCNALLLDEPTNHLDVETVDVLVDALRGFEGGLLLVSHDRWVVEQLATHVGVVRDGRLVITQGVRPRDFELDVGPPETEARPQSEGARDHAARKRAARAAEKRARRMAAIENEIANIEEEMAAIETAQFEEAANHERAAELASKQAEHQARIESLFAEWETLESASEADEPSTSA